MTNFSSSFILMSLGVAFLIFLIIAIPKLIGDHEREKGEKDKNISRNLIVLQPSLPASDEKNQLVKPEIIPHQQILGPGGTQWIYQ